jgi:hypothetical protein
MAKLTAPVVTWWNYDAETLVTDPSNTTNTIEYGITGDPYDFGIVDAGYVPSEEDFHHFLVWNNKDSMDYAPTMEDVTIGIKDSEGDNGDITGKEVWAINGDTKWFQAFSPTLGETSTNFAQIGADITHPIGSGTGITTHPDVLSGTTTTWSASVAYNIGDIIAPTVDNGFVYEVISAGTTLPTEPTWSTEDLAEFKEEELGNLQYRTVKKERSAPTNNQDRILGGENNGSYAEAKANFAHVTMKIVVPSSARAGRQDIKVRTSYRFV